MPMAAQSDLRDKNKNCRTHTQTHIHSHTHTVQIHTTFLKHWSLEVSRKHHLTLNHLQWGEVTLVDKMK